jgi:hypothetical protein
MHKYKPEQYLNDYYMMARYMQAYEPQVRAMPKLEEWPTTDGCDEIMSPIVRVQLGRPRKVRRRAPDQATNPYKISRSGYVVMCRNCRGQCHNYKGCHLHLNLNRKR